MKRLTTVVRNLVRQEDGAAMVEYALLAALIAIIAILVLKGLGSKVSNTFSTVNSALP